MIYTIVAWSAAVGDGIVILLCGLTVLAVLRANKHRGLAALLYHLLAWASFLMATLSKQSSFTIPLIVFLLVSSGYFLLINRSCYAIIAKR